MKRIDFDAKVGELRKQGLCCAQIVLMSGLEIRGEENPQMVHAARTFCSGRHNRKTCGALSGGALLLGLWDSPKTSAMVRELDNWFDAEFGTSACGKLLELKRVDERYSCGNLIRASVNKCQDLLVEQGLIEE